MGLTSLGLFDTAFYPCRGMERPGWRERIILVGIDICKHTYSGCFHCYICRRECSKELVQGAPQRTSVIREDDVDKETAAGIRQHQSFEIAGQLTASKGNHA